jgi:hypothetical protein
MVSLSMLAACASIVEGTDQSVTVITEPVGASCQLERDGTKIAIVSPTPGTVQVEKSKRDMSVTCTKDQHETSMAVLVSSFQAMTVGNAVFGWGIGVIVDASTGAMNKYPESVTIIMPPLAFASIKDRDIFYDGLITSVKARTNKQISQIVSQCGSPNSAECKASVGFVEKSRDAEIADLESKRARATIAS